MNQVTVGMTNLKDNDYRRYTVMRKSNNSYALNHQIVEHFNSYSWANRRCFIIGGGESVKDVDLHLLDGELTIGINRTFQFYPQVKINYAMDSDFYEALKQGRYDLVKGETPVWEHWKNYQGRKVFLSPMEVKKYGDEVCLVRRIPYQEVSTCIEDGIYGGHNSGLGAIMLAIALGCREIYLIGYDMIADTRTHWHAGYPNRDINDFRNKLIGYRKEIEDMAPLIKAKRIEIFNLNPKSGLECFPFMEPQNVLKG